MNYNQTVARQITIVQLSKRLRTGWYYWLGGSLLGGLAAGATILLLPPKFEAIAILQLAQVGVVGQPAPVIVEPVVRVIERLRSPSFQMAVAQLVEDRDWMRALSNSPVTTGGPISTELLNGGPLILLKGLANTPDHAKAIVSSTIQVLAKQHTEIADPLIELIQFDLSINKEKLAQLEKATEGVRRLEADSVVRDDRLTQLFLIATIKIQRENEVIQLRQSIGAYERALKPPATQPTKAVEEIYVGRKPISPKKALLLALGTTCGLLAGLLALFVTDLRSLGRKQNPPVLKKDLAH